MSSPQSPNRPFLLVTLYWGLFLTAAILIRRVTISPVYANFWVDTIFNYSMAIFILGAIIHLANTSRRHYYKHLKAREKDQNLDDSDFNKEEVSRSRFSRTGQKIALAGVVGVVISFTLMLL